MTKTALENKKLASNEKIAREDRELREREFKHKKIMDIANAVTGGVLNLFTGGKSGAVSGAKRNGPEFYKNYVKDLDKFTNLSTFVRNGAQFYDGLHHGMIYKDGTTGDIQIVREAAVPAIAVIEWIPTIGNGTVSSTNISQTPINQVLMRTKEQVLKSNSRSNVPYEAADLGLNFLATGSILVAICEYEKLILIGQTYKADNAYFADALLKSMGVTDPSNWLNNLPQARQNLILLKKRFNSALVAPSALSLYKKYVYLGTMWCKDSECNPYSIYTFKAHNYLKLSDSGEVLNYEAPSRSTPSTFYNQISGMIQRIAEHPDFQAMYADLRSAFSSLVQLDENFNENAIIEANHDTMAMEQIANIQTLPLIYNDEILEGAVVQDSVVVRQTESGYLYQGKTANEQGIVVAYSNTEFNYTPPIKDIMDGLHLINFHKDNITGDDVLDATRWHFTIGNMWSSSDQEELYLRVMDCDVAVALCIYTYTNERRFSFTNSVWTQGFYSHRAGSHIFNPAVTSATVMQSDIKDGITTALAFDWMPIIRTAFSDTDQSRQMTKIEAYGDVQHLVPVSAENIKRLNEVCVLSEFYIDSPAFKR